MVNSWTICHGGSMGEIPMIMHVNVKQKGWHSSIDTTPVYKDRLGNGFVLLGFGPYIRYGIVNCLCIKLVTTRTWGNGRAYGQCVCNQLIGLF